MHTPHITERHQAEVALRESEERYRTLFDLSLDSIFVHHHDVLVYVNPAGVRLLKAASQEELIGKSILDFVHPDYRQTLRQHVREIIQAQQTANWYEEKIIRLDGTLIDVEVGITMLTLSGKPHFQTIIRDITDRKHIVEQLAQERMLLRTLIDSLPDLVYVKDRDSRFVMMNRIPHEQMTFSLDQIIGHTDFDLFPEEIATNFYADEQSIMNTGQPVLNQEEYVVTPAGDIMWVSTTKVPFQNSDGTISGIVGITRDVTKQYQVTRALEASEARFRLIMENSHEGIILTNEQAQILMVNPAACRIFGRNEAEMLGSKRSDLMDETEARFHNFSDEVKKTRHGQCELTGFHPDHTAFPIEVSISLFASQDGKEQLGSMSIRDMSEHHRYQLALIEQERLKMALSKEAELSQLKTRMMERIAHEFRTPLAIIQASTESLEAYHERFTAEQRAVKFKKIYMQVQHLTGIMEQIGLVMSGNRAPRTVHLGSADLSALCRQTALELEKQFDRPGKFSLDLPESIMVRADVAILKQALFHVMFNAAQFSTPSSTVMVSISVRDQGVDVMVRDSGIGILPEELGRIFEAFFRGSNIGVVSGLGLGLTVAKANVELHKGTITVESVPGQGTTVQIWLPYLTG